MYQVVLEQIKTILCRDEQTALALLDQVDCNARIELDGQLVGEKNVSIDFDSNLKAAYFLQEIIDQDNLENMKNEGLPDGFREKFCHMLAYISKCRHNHKALIISGYSSRALIRTLVFFNRRKTDNYYPPLSPKLRAYEHAVILKRYHNEDRAVLSQLGIIWQQQYNIAIYDIQDNDDNYMFGGPADEDESFNITWELISERLHENIKTATILGLNDTPFSIWRIVGDDELATRLMDRCEIYYPDLPLDHSDVVGFTSAIPVSTDYSFKDYVN